MEGNGIDEDPRKTLVYLGPSLSLIKAMEFLPFATYRPPARQGDIVSDLVNLSPSRILLIDGEFRQNLSVWHKELVYALQYPGLKAVYGASSMGAIRAAELDYLGMVGVGRIYEWYANGTTEDEAEVAVHYSKHKNGYHLHSVPLIDIRAGVEQYDPNGIRGQAAREFLEEMREVYYMERTRDVCSEAWAKLGGESFDCPFPYASQKEEDAIDLLTNYAKHKRQAQIEPEPEHLTMFFQALYERDRRIKINGFEVPQQHIDAHVILHNPEYERICWDSSNQELALMLCNCLSVTVTMEEISRESARFQQKAGLSSKEEFDHFLETNGWSHHEYDRLMIQNARIRKLQHSLTVTKAYRRNTQSILDYLRTHQGFDYWAKEAVELEGLIQKSGADDWLGINLETPVFQLLAEHFEREGLELKCLPEDYLLETGFSNLTELGIALARTKAGKEQNE
jgi:hypothetical protein